MLIMYFLQNVILTEFFVPSAVQQNVYYFGYWHLIYLLIIIIKLLNSC